MVRRAFFVWVTGFLLAFSPILLPSGVCLATLIPSVPDVQQPITGSLGNPTTNSCAPVSVVNVTEYWDNVMSDPNANMVNAGLVPNTAADYISYFVDHGNWGSPARANGTIYLASAGTYAVDIQPGFTEYVRWDATHLFTTPPPALPAGKLGYDWNSSADFVAGFFQHVAAIDSGHPDVLCFQYWNPIPSGVILPDPSGEMIEFYTWGPQTGGSGPPNPYETWNLNYGQECVGHAVTGVGYFINYDPDGSGPLPNTNWFICHDNWPTTGINVALPWSNWAATIFGDPGIIEEPPEIAYWKPDTTYAQTGMPDFSSQQPCHSGATAVTNCLWWYGAMDYYQFINPRQLKDELLVYFAADTIFDPWGGTDVHVMEAGLDAFFTDVMPPWPFHETTFQMPDFRVMAESLMKCQDVILLIGNWWQDDAGGWWRDGGRYVTMAGVDTATMSIALSDPETDNAEAGGYGRIRPPHALHPATDNTHWLPVTPGSYDYPVSHDAYNVILGSPSPGGTWWIPGFPRGFSPAYANCPTEFMPMTQANPNPALYPYHAEVEYAVMICPMRLNIPDIDVLPESLWYQQNSYTDIIYPDQISICNVGTGNLNIYSITSDHSWITAGAFSSPLAPGGCDLIEVEIISMGIMGGTYTGQFHVSSDDPDEMVVNKPWYSVTIVEPNITVAPDSIYHSQLVNTMQMYPNDFTISNTGTAPLNYMANNALPWIGLMGVTGMILPGGADLIGLSVNTNGVAPGVYVDMVTVNSDDPDTPMLHKPQIVIEVLPPEIDICDYYKAAYMDYVPNGVPDFDQKQDNWRNPQSMAWSWCGPVALANCIWWFDSKFEANPVDPRPFHPTGPPPNDHYPLLGPFGPWDDHDLANVMPFVSALGPMCGVDGPSAGTPLPLLQAGFHNWLTSVGLQGQYTTHIVMGPGYPEIRDSILSSQDVILLLGFYEFLPSQECQRVGGHYVTCAGACIQEPAVCISDPFLDSNEGEPPPGMAHGSAVHNDAFFVSGPHGTINHDRYNMAPVGQPCPISPATWMLTDYPNGWTQHGLMNFANQNPILPGMPPAVYQGGPIVVLVDAALIICPAPEQVPDINVVPDSIFHSLPINTTQTYVGDLTISNTGTGNLNWSASNTLSWITLSSYSGAIPPAGNAAIDLTVNTNSIPVGTYLDTVRISSNDPDEPLINAPRIVIEVTEGEIECAYIPGDMNGIGGANGIDVVYGVNFLKGGAPPTIDCNPPCLTYTNPNPPYQQLPLADPFYAAMDVNGNCGANGIDITYFVAFLKGQQPSLKWCLDCPPADRILPIKFPGSQTGAVERRGGGK